MEICCTLKWLIFITEFHVKVLSKYSSQINDLNLFSYFEIGLKNYNCTE